MAGPYMYIIKYRATVVADAICLILLFVNPAKLTL